MNTQKSAACRGFTLIEMIGVLAVIAILASAIVPNMIQTVLRARADQETTTLNTLADNLEHYILTNRQIPSPATATWTAALASVSNLPTDKVEYNENGFRRAIYFDPRFFSTSDTTFTGYTQQAGASDVVSPRVMIVSNLQANAPSAPANTADFSAIWDQTSAAALLESDTVKIERRNLSSLFHRATLVNEWSVAASYQLENASAFTVSANNLLNPVEIYVIKNTQMELIDSSDNGGNLDQLVTVATRKHYNYRSDGSDGYWEQP